MKNQDLLTKELIRHIFNIFGFSELFIENIVGITFDKYKKSKITVDYDDIGIKEFPIYSALTIKNNSKLKVLGVMTSDGENNEICVVFKCDDLITYALKTSSDVQEATFLTINSDGSWGNPSMADKLNATLGLELLNDFGINWKIEVVDRHLYDILMKLVEM